VGEEARVDEPAVAPALAADQPKGPGVKKLRRIERKIKRRAKKGKGQPKGKEGPSAG
jgi:hypothetical protein